MFELINASADVRRVRLYLEQYGGDLAAVFDGLVEEGLEELGTRLLRTTKNQPLYSAIRKEWLNLSAGTVQTETTERTGNDRMI